GDFAGAGGWAARGLERFPGENRLRVLAARAFIGLKQTAKARTELLLVLQNEPHHAEAKALFKPL
ncbi:MAG TPA: tetratricopeptide repeat protein, partial [Myxococcales bacterium]|nr:tetratricopeptide repeat protein [Myxococcales bacterium]